MKTILALCLTIVAISGFLLWRSTQLPTRFGAFT